MSKNLQAFVLVNMLKAAGDKGVTKAEVAKALNIQENSVPVYFFGIKKRCNAEIGTIKNGRNIVAYTLLNPNEILEVPQTRNTIKVAKATKPVKKAPTNKVIKEIKSKKNIQTVDTDNIPILDENLHIAELGDAEYNDIKSQLGLM